MAEPVPYPTATALPPLPETLPETTNPYLLAGGSATLYNSIFLLASQAVLQHFLVFGIAALLRGYSFKRLLDLHYLTLLVALSIAAGPAVFLLYPEFGQLKLLFFLEHEAIEFLIFVRVVAPPHIVKRFSGLIMFVAWTVLFMVTVVVVLDQFHHSAAMLAAWGAFSSDLAMGVAGIVLVKRWMTSTSRSNFGARRIQAEGLAGIGYMAHGFVTMCVPPIFACVLYEKMHPDWFAYGWVMVWISGYFAIALCIPAIALFFWNISWCCARRRQVFPGQAGWEDDWEEDGRRSMARTIEDGRAMARTMGVTMAYHKEPFVIS